METREPSRLPCVAKRMYVDGKDSCNLVIYHCRPSTFPEAGVSFSAAPYRQIPITAAPKRNRHSSDLLHSVLPYDMDAVDFLHHENPPTLVGIDNAILCAEG
ncbi:hypothetical protein TNCV_2873921 [Trichonephila clavipes]|nr:hypothetical protein TNCV_2873921 [Trichonephila clavipes]